MSVHRTIAEDEAEERHNQEVARLRVSRDRLLVAAKDLLDTIPAPPTDDGRRVFEALRHAIWDAAP